MSRVVINEAGIRRLFANPNGPVARIVNQKADEILRLGKEIAASKFESRSGDLEDSFKKVPIQSPDGYRVAVGASAQHGFGRPSGAFPYARALETGINPITGAAMNFKNVKPGYMVPAVRQAGFVQRS